MRILNILVMTAFFAGCALSPVERAAQAERDVEQMVQVFGPACNKLGYQKDTDSWRNCVLQLAAQDDIKRYGRYNSYPTSTQCVGNRGFFNCTSF